MNIISFILFLLNLKICFAESITFDSPVRYLKNEDNQYIELKSKEELILKSGDKVFVNPNDNLPFFIYSTSSDKTFIHIPGNQLKNLDQERTTAQVEKMTNSVLGQIRQIDSMIASRNFKEALNQVNDLKLKYRHLSEIYFLSGTVNYLLNNKSVAIKDLESGLSINAENKAAKKLLETARKEL